MAALDEHLVHRDTSQPSPGYIQGYVPGVREATRVMPLPSPSTRSNPM